jgi:hypothetical protein
MQSVRTSACFAGSGGTELGLLVAYLSGRVAKLAR